MGPALRNLLVLALCCGCAKTPSSTFEITITGDSRFDGQYTVTREGVTSTVHWEDTLPPLSIPERGSAVSVSVRKKQAPGVLRVEIVRDGKVVASQATTRNHGPLDLESR